MITSSAIFLFSVLLASGQYVSKNAPPRFKQSIRRHQYTYLGDTTKFRCDSIGRPLPKVHWYRNGQYLNYSFMHERPRIQEKGMELEIRRVEVEDKGQWTCRVWNSEGSIIRNFTLHIIDFCDFYLTSEAEATNVPTPEACLCEWISTDDPAFESDSEILRFRDQYCQAYEKENEVTKFRTTAHLTHNGNEHSDDRYKPLKGRRIANMDDSRFEDGEDDNEDDEEDVRDFAPSYLLHKGSSHIAHLHHTNTPLDPVALFDELVRTQIPDLNTIMPGLMTSAEMLDLRHQLNTYWPKDTESKLERAKQILKHRIPILEQEHEKMAKLALEKQEQADKSDATIENVKRAPEMRDTISEMAEITTRPDIDPQTNRWTTRTWKMPLTPTRVAPYFRQTEEDTNVVIPSGRTLRLNCKAGGIPEPQVIWRKDHVEIGLDTERKSGSIYRLRKWSLELEDAAEADSGHYTCDIFNNVGAIRRDFRVDVRDRIRARPIILPNILMNKTIDVNGTVNFTCQVLSDLVPHVVWIHLVQINGSYVRWDPKQAHSVFNFVDMSTVKRAHIFHDNQKKQYTLTITDVKVEDQGIYSCVAGNTLGISMANATLTVNEFRAMSLPTDNPYSPWPLIYTIFLILLVMSLVSFLTLSLMYYFFSRKTRKAGLQNLDKMTIRKKVVITKKPPREGDGWSDLASSYTITVEPIVGKGHSRSRTRVNSESSLVSEYEVPTDKSYEIDRQRIKLLDIVGEGAFGEVWRGILKPQNEKKSNAGKEMAVAVKKLKPAAQEKELIILVSEMQIFKSIGNHKNILKLIGCCTGTGPLYMILELCPHGNLRDFLRRHRPNSSEAQHEDSQENIFPSLHASRKATIEQNGMDSTAMVIRNLTLRDLIRFATEVSAGMEFLSSKKIIHRDLAARNILVASDFTAKISDFGLSRKVFCQDYYRKRGAGRLPIKWMAPEALEANVYTVYSDIWSYGVLLWEVMTLGGTPYPSIAMPQLYNLLKEGYRMEAPHNCPEEIYGVMIMCWQEKPESRPQFQTICDYLEWLVSEAVKMNTAGMDDHYLDTEEGVETSLNSNTHTKPSRPLSAPGLMSIQSFARGLPSLGVSDLIDRRHHESTPLLCDQQLNNNKNRSKHSTAQGQPILWDGIFEERTSAKHSHSSNTQHNVLTKQNSSNQATVPLLQNHHQIQEQQRPPIQRQQQFEEPEYHEPMPYVNVSNEYMNNAGNDQIPGPSVTTTTHVVHEKTSKPMNLRSAPMPKLSNAQQMDLMINGDVQANDKAQLMMPRSQSVESSSSGHGGSSAMSSAEGLGTIADFCHIQIPNLGPRAPSNESKTP